MTDYYLRPATVTHSGPQDLSATSQTPAFSQHTDAAAFPVTGTTARLYLALDTEILYYWTGAAYAQCIGGA